MSPEAITEVFFLSGIGVMIACVVALWLILTWKPRQKRPRPRAAPTPAVRSPWTPYAPPAPPPPKPGPLPRWTADRRQDAAREQEIWQKTFDHSA